MAVAEFVLRQFEQVAKSVRFRSALLGFVWRQSGSIRRRCNLPAGIQPERVSHEGHFAAAVRGHNITPAFDAKAYRIHAD